MPSPSLSIFSNIFFAPAACSVAETLPLLSASIICNSEWPEPCFDSSPACAVTASAKPPTTHHSIREVFMTSSATIGYRGTPSSLAKFRRAIHHSASALAGKLLQQHVPVRQLAIEGLDRQT